MLQIFYLSVMASVLLFGWWCNNRASDTFNLNRLVKKAGVVVGSSIQGVEEVTRERTSRKLDSIDTHDYKSPPPNGTATPFLVRQNGILQVCP